jgi:transposase
MKPYPHLLFKLFVLYLDCRRLTDELHQTNNILVRDLPISGQTVYLKVPRRKFYCKQCQRYFTENLEFMEARRKYTVRYGEYI